MTLRARLARLKKGQALTLPGAYDALSALLIQDAGFDAFYLSGAGLSVSVLGKPDIGLLTLDEVAFVASRVAGAVSLPFLVDADTGFGGPANVWRAVRALEAAGAAAVQIEDQTFPKRCGHLKGKDVVPVEEMCAKIRAACAARRSKDFLIVARTDARGVTGLRDALTRAQAYRRAGADLIFPEALENEAEFAAFGRNKTLGPLIANMTEFGRSPGLTVEQLAHLGYRLVLFPMTAFRIAAFAMRDALRYLQRKGESQGLLARMQTRAELYRLNRYDRFDAAERDWLASRVRPGRSNPNRRRSR
jgi:methylisocitrate lyase